MHAWVHVGELVRNWENLEHTSKVIKHMSFNRTHEKNAINSHFSAHEHQVRNELANFVNMPSNRM